MFENSFKIFSLLGIPVRLSISWLPIFGLALFMAHQFYATRFPDVSDTGVWLMAMTVTVVSFLSLLAHEFGHAMAARSIGIHVQSIELFIFGGLARMVGYSTRPRNEFVLAVAGPAATFVLTVVFALLYWHTHPQGWWADPTEPVNPIKEMAKYVFAFNGGLLVFNLIPGYPLDGGRAFQAVLWYLTGKRGFSAWIVTVAGFFMAALMIIGGTILVVLQDWHLHALLIALLFSLVGIYMARTAMANYKGTRILERVGTMSAASALDPDVTAAPATVTLQELGEGAVRSDDAPTVVLLDAEGRATATISYDDDDQWPASVTRTAEVAQTLLPNQRTASTTPLLDVLSIMAGNGGWLIVENESGGYVGMVTRNSLKVAFEVAPKA